MSTLYRIRTAITGGPGGNELSTMFWNAASTSAQDAADAVHDFWAAVAPHISNAYVLAVEDIVYSIDSTTGQPTASTAVSTAGIGGGSGGDPLPAMTNGVIRVTTPLFVAGRQLQGKIWVPGPTETDNAGALPTNTYRSDLLAAANTYLIVPANGFVVFSRTHKQFDAVTGAAVWSQWGSLRSRRT